MKQTVLVIATLVGAISATSANANNYWMDVHHNQGEHFDGYEYTPNTLGDWKIESNDRYIAGNFLNYSMEEMVLAIKPGSRFILMKHVGFRNEWWQLFAGGNNLGGYWPTSTSDKYVIGEFDGDGRYELLAANPDGRYRTLKIAGSPHTYWWESMQFATNGNIDATDQLIVGDFDGDNIDETMLIKQNGSHYTMKYNTNTHNWDIISSASTGSIYWWRIAANDQYIVGDFNNDGKEELLAVNPNGWHHVMQYNNNQWQYLSGNGSGALGYWRISASDRYVAGDYDADGQDELLAINPNNGWSHTIEFNSNQFQWRQGNNGSGKIASTTLTPNTKIIKQHIIYQDKISTFDPNGDWSMVKLCNVGC